MCNQKGKQKFENVLFRANLRTKAETPPTAHTPDAESRGGNIAQRTHIDYTEYTCIYLCLPLRDSMSRG